MKKKILIPLALITMSVAAYSDDVKPVTKEKPIKESSKKSDRDTSKGLVDILSNYKSDIQLNLGYDLYRGISEVPEGRKKGSMNQGFTLGAEYLLQPRDKTNKFLYGLGFEYRSRLKNSEGEAHLSIPVFGSVRYPFYHDRFYAIGRLGFAVNSGQGSTNGGHYIGLGIGKKMGYVHVEAMWENTGYKYEDKDYGFENRVGIKFGFRLGEIYYDITHPKPKPVAKKPKIQIIKEEKTHVIIKNIVEVREVYIIRESGLRYKLNKYRLTKETKNYLDRLKKQDLQEGTYKKVIIAGHTDKSGSKKHNKELSKKRANAVADYLNLPKDKVEVKGLGETNSLGGSPKDDRRVEIEVRR